MISFYIGKTRCCFWFSFFAVICLFYALGESKWGIWCVFASLLHECGHVAAFAQMGVSPKELHFEYSGIRLIPADRPLSFGQELLVLLAGSATNVILGGILLWGFHLPIHAAFHLVLGGFNLLPLSGLDGGHILLLTLRRFFPTRGDGVAIAVSLLTQGILSVYALQLFMQTKNFTLLLVVVYFFLLTILKTK